MGRPREAVDAAVLAAAVGIDRAIEGDIGQVVAGDDLAGGIDGHGGLERRQLLEALPAIVECDPRQRLVTAGCIRLRAAAAPARWQPRRRAASAAFRGRCGRRSGAQSRPPARRAGAPADASAAAEGRAMGNHIVAIGTKQEHIFFEPDRAERKQIRRITRSRLNPREPPGKRKGNSHENFHNLRSRRLSDLIGGSNAKAAPWCAHYDASTYNCGFHSYQQCLENIRGIGGYCARNRWESRGRG